MDGLSAGARYRFALSSGQRVPDPASRFQPDDVNGPSEAIDPRTYRWRESWKGREWDDIVLYELHVGAFSPQGTFAGAALKLDHLADLGVTAVEIMPVSDFKGRWNWGYDGAFPYAPDASYGRPEDFKAFVEAAHERGIAVLLDVVYNHFGPEGNFLSALCARFLHQPAQNALGRRDPASTDPTRDPCATSSSRTPNIGSRSFISTGFASTPSTRSRTIRGPICSTNSPCAFARDSHGPSISSWKTRAMIRSRLTRHGGKADLYTAQWNDDIHHVLHVAATHESSGYYAAYGSTELLGKSHRRRLRLPGRDDALSECAARRPERRIAADAFVSFIQNHDQIGNRAFGERLNVLAPPEAMRALASVYLLAPQIPMLFMGEEWGATQPFLFFCDFSGELAEAVRKGRREEFSRFPEFADPERVAKIPDPCAESTFLASKLDWSRIDPKHLAYYRELLKVRREFVRPLAAFHSTWGRGARRGRASGAGHLAGWRAAARARRQSLVQSCRLSSDRSRSVLALRRGRRFLWALDRALGTRSCMNAPRATYRLQLHAGFGFNDAAAIAPYLAQLGVSHVYLSPIFKARPGSVHGYDVTDHNQLNPELGTEEDFASMIEAFRREGLGRILDIVPNHMGVWGADNPLWLDVLEWGPYSQYAGWFDIDWSAQDGKLLAPVLGAQYGEELRSGKLKLHFEADGSFAVWAYDAHKLPIHPLTFPQILGHQNPALDRIGDLFLDLAPMAPASGGEGARIEERTRFSRQRRPQRAHSDRCSGRGVQQRLART